MRQVRKFLIVFFLTMVATPLWAETLETKGYRVVIEQRCAEGNVTCADVRYQGVSRTSGNSIELIGSTHHSRCKDGSPCRFLGYIFNNGPYRYFVSAEGRLRVSRQRPQGEEVLINEVGEWR